MRIAIALLAAVAAFGQGYSPSEAPKHFQLAPGFRATVYASEPEVRQPILVKFDDRGRLWTIQYLQYPNPAGLKRVSVDRYSRTIYDRVPEPPPRGPKGADRLTILADTDGDHRADRFKDFVSDLNLCTGIAFGYGGVFVVQAPYLLFYPDRNRDDIPDSAPEVLLSGFGMEDAQSMANHLTWGPDGWLYGLNGSTTTSKIRDLEFQQGVWRYHPVTREVELFAEGGGNIYGLTFDADGNLFYSSNGSALFWHAVQGGYFQKNFGKHGPLHNPYTYGHFPHVKHNGVNGGHVVLGGTSYLADSFPAPFRGTFLGANFLSHHVSWWNVKPLGATVEASYGGKIFDTMDSWSNPTDVALGPDGAIYICDFFDVRTAHPDPDAEWDRSNGRIYKLMAGNAPAAPAFDLARLSSKELVKMLDHWNGWFEERARMLLAARRDATVYPALRETARTTADGRRALRSLWALYVSGGWNEALAMELLSHPYEYVRYWNVRFLGDGKKVSPAAARRLKELAASEPSAVVRSQLASTAKRLPGRSGLDIALALLDQNRDAADPHVPLLIWWALENKALSEADALAAYFARASLWERPMHREAGERLIRRYAAEGNATGYAAVHRILKLAPVTALAALDQGLSERAGAAPVADTALYKDLGEIRRPSSQGRIYAAISGPLREFIAAKWNKAPTDPVRARLALRAGLPGVEDALVKQGTPQALAVLGELGSPRIIPQLLAKLEGADSTIRLAALNALERFDDPAIATKLIAAYPGMPPALKNRARDLLFSRETTAASFLSLLESNTALAAEVPPAQARLIAALESKALDARVRKLWGNIGRGTKEEKLATMRRFNNDLRAAEGDAKSGVRLYVQHCASCHKLNGSGGELGMDLTNANRADRNYLLTHVVDPSVYIRKEYMTFEVRTTGGRRVSGLMSEQDAASVTLIDATYRRMRIPRAEIAAIEESEISVMPEGILEKLTPAQLRDLFAYLQAK